MPIEIPYYRTIYKESAHTMNFFNYCKFTVIINLKGATDGNVCVCHLTIPRSNDTARIFGRSNMVRLYVVNSRIE